MWSSLYSPCLLALQVSITLANTEKVIFLGPPNINVPLDHPTIGDLHLDTLSPEHWSLRTHIRAEFPTNSSKYGHASWYLLDHLRAGQRYEVRVCWAATEPTSFRLEAYDLSTTFETPELITSLAKYSEGRQLENEPSSDSRRHSFQHSSDVSMLLLQVYAAADYYTMNKTLMTSVPPVFVDIILDPFIFNVLPRSLLPTVAYIILLAIGSWYSSKRISKWLEAIAQQPKDTVKKDK
ncbi:hypothetical protein BJ875DRAFT_96803 [Amylocarpus encephaloides]|uniref:Uncharacterized protein n=1 Tax=Amylocarpus encephaloides TaxID=45428 RepID=A0A9P8C341_9HELO|nr:hypothetical protein BJ875DRAFT_96803 [Amylocarpus encephaloides]